MNKRLFLVVLLVIIAATAFSQTPNPVELLRRVDENEVYTTIQYEGDIIIEYQGRRYVKTMQAWARGNEFSFIEFTNREDYGTRYLKRDGRLYVYSPDTEEVILISGHMLRESMMGSDMSYEDTLDNAPLSSRYTPVLAGSEIINGRDAWVLQLTAINRTESYPTRKLWIDKEYGDLLRYELFALSGVKVKEYTLLEVQVIDGIRFPVRGEMRDLMRRDSRTTFVMRNVILNRPIADSIFTMRNLER